MSAAPLRWDVFCRVIDNHGDLGVCWRLAADLATRGEQVRLWVDDASALGWMAPRGAPGIEIRSWPGESDDTLLPPAGDDATPELGDVVVEAFGCALPAAVVAWMGAAARAPVWINLEYLSAEAYVERSHALRSPQSNGLPKWFYYPGFTARTGGLLREPGLIARRAAFDADAWLAKLGLQRRHGEQVVSLFCYEQPALPALIHRLAAQPTLLLATPGHAMRQLDALLGPTLRRGMLRAVALPPLTQPGYDELLWACDLNFVRGEDSFVRAQWAGRPFVWQIYPQHDDAHLLKLAAFLDRFLADADPMFANSVRAVHATWNGAASSSGSAETVWPTASAWTGESERWRTGLLTQPDLTSRLLAFVADRR